MTDLEELWDDYPGGEPPVADLLRKGRAEARARRRRYLVRPLLVGATAAAVASAFVVGTHVQDGAPDSTASSADSGADAGADNAAGGALAAPALRHSAFQADLQPADTCAALLRSYQDRALKQVGPYGWTGDGVLQSRQADFAAAAPLASSKGADVSGRADGVANGVTGTNVQEALVDEPDRVKTNGTLLVRAGHDGIKVYDVSGAEVRLDATLTLPDLQDPQLLLDGTTLVALGTDTARSATAATLAPYGGGTRVTTVSLADAGRPSITSQVRYSGTLDTARLQGTDVHLVLADSLPDLSFVQPHLGDGSAGGLSEKEAAARNREIVKATTLDDWLPRYDDGTGSRPLLACDRVALPPAGVALGTESVVGFDVARPTTPAAIGIAGTTALAYESADRLYLTTGGSGGCMDCPQPPVDGRFAMPGGPEARTTIFQLDLDGIHATHVATGTVDGSVADRWSMDEADGVLRVATTESTKGGQQSSVVTMRPDGDKLVEIGRLDGLGVNETLTAARWFDDLAVLSTARQTDPLFTVDLTDPAHPTLLGALHIPGFSDYFHPIGDDQLLGIGQAVSFENSDEREQAQVGLFDIGDLTDVKQVAVDSLGQWTWPYAGEDPHAFTWLPDRSTAITSFVTRDGSALLGIYQVDGSTLSQKLIPLEDHRHAMTVRTMELPSGKVVLMAGGRVSFLDV